MIRSDRWNCCQLSDHIINASYFNSVRNVRMEILLNNKYKHINISVNILFSMFRTVFSLCVNLFINKQLLNNHIYTIFLAAAKLRLQASAGAGSFRGGAFGGSCHWLMVKQIRIQWSSNDPVMIGFDLCLSCGSSPSSFAARLRALDKAYPGDDALQNLPEKAMLAWYLHVRSWKLRSSWKVV